MREWLARWWAHRKLHRGQCLHCGQALRDDKQAFCSEDCDVTYNAKAAW